MKVAGFFLASLFVAAVNVSAQIIPIDFDAGDSTSLDGWNLQRSIFPGRGFFPGVADWANGPAGSNIGDGDAELAKVANGAFGGPYIAEFSLYFGATEEVPGAFGGTVGITDITPLGDLNTIVLQIQIGEAQGFDLYNDQPPTLMLNGTTSVDLEFFALINRFQDGTFEIPGSDPPQEEPLYVNTWGFQWDLSGFSDPITSFSIQFSGVEHAQVRAIQLNQSNGVYETSLVPEPSTWILMVVGLGSLLIYGFRKRVGRLSPVPASPPETLARMRCGRGLREALRAGSRL